MMKDLVIIGAGITGLSIAHKLKDSSIDFILLEKDNDPGGKIKTIKKDGFTCECGPNTILYQEETLKDLISDLGLEESLIFANESRSKNRYILNQKGIEALPSSPGSFFSSNLLSTGSKWRVLTDYFRSIDLDISNASVAEYFESRYGRSVVENIIDPFVTGIYAGDPFKMSFQYSFPKLYEFEREYGNIIKGFIKSSKRKNNKKQDRKGIFSFENGLQTLTDRLWKIGGERLINGAEVVEVKSNSDDFLIRYSLNGKTESIASKLVVDTRPMDLSFNSLGIDKLPITPPYVPIISLHLGFKRKDTSKVPHGFGLLTTKKSSRSYLGAIFSSSIFPHTAPDDQDLFTILIGGSRRPEIANMDSGAIINEVVRDFKSDMEIMADPVFINSFYWNKAIPQYNLGHERVEAEIDSFRNQYPNYILAGNYHDGVSIGDRVKAAFNIALSIINRGSKQI